MSSTEDLATEAVRLAVAAAGPIGGNVPAWLHRITESVPVIAAILRPPMQGRENDPGVMAVVARKVLESSVFKAEYVDHELEESSQRIIARFKSETTNKSDKESDGTEHIRTEAMWSPAGRLMRSKLDQLAPGQDVIVYKHMEQIDGNRSVRVLSHLVALGKPPDQQSRTAVEPRPSTHGQAPAARSETAGATPPAVSRPQSTEPPADEPHGEHWVLVQDRLNGLTATQKVAWKALCKGSKVENFLDPSGAEIDRVLVAFSQVEKPDAAD